MTVSKTYSFGIARINKQHFLSIATKHDVFTNTGYTRTMINDNVTLTILT